METSGFRQALVATPMLGGAPYPARDITTFFYPNTMGVQRETDS